jgi:hypothetical protein
MSNFDVMIINLSMPFHIRLMICFITLIDPYNEFLKQIAQTALTNLTSPNDVNRLCLRRIH